MAIIALINSSVQRKNYTGFTLSIVKEELKKNNLSVIEINLKDFSLPFPGEEKVKDDSKKMQELIKKCRCIHNRLSGIQWKFYGKT